MPLSVTVHFDAPVERVFEALTDHETFLTSKDGTKTTIIRPGAATRNGLGCIRAVRAAGVLRFVEEVTAWDPPTSYEYLIREASVPVRHHGGRLTFTKAGAGTDVEWTTRFDVAIPLVGRLFKKPTEWAFTLVFKRFLGAAKERLAASSAS